MTQKEKALEYVESQRSLHLYELVKQVFIEVLASLPSDDFNSITNNLKLMVLHEAAIAQVMHFEPQEMSFEVLQLTVPDDMPDSVLKWVIAHELGHVMQKRNWRDGDGEELETDADARAEKWGYVKTESIKDYLKKRR